MTLNDVKNFFKHSETILWSRLQVMLGILYGVVAVTDMSPILTDPKWLTAWLITNGFFSEYLRRRGTETQSVITNAAAIQNSGAAPVVMQMLTSTPPPGA